MESELSYISIYLRYNIKAITKNRRVKQITINGYYFTDGGSLQFNSVELYGGVSKSEITIILRPITDLFKPVYHYWAELQDFCDTDAERDAIYSVLFMGDYDKLEYLPYTVIQWLAERHFDLGNYIGNGLAVDINSL